MPQNANRRGTVAACEQSLKRLRTDRLDLFLLHWQGSVPLAETMEAFLTLEKSGKIRAFGVSNFDTADMERAAALPGGEKNATNQVLYNLARRGAEWDLLPWQRKRKIPLMAYSPLDQGRILRNRTLVSLARERGVSPAALALAWVLRDKTVFAVVKAASPDHVRDNFAAARLTISAEDCAALDRAFPPPKQGTPLEIL
jgi:diketogulonate reductase-like aldo/keto reductase